LSGANLASPIKTGDIFTTVLRLLVLVLAWKISFTSLVGTDLGGYQVTLLTANSRRWTAVPVQGEANYDNCCSIAHNVMRPSNMPQYASCPSVCSLARDVASYKRPLLSGTALWLCLSADRLSVRSTACAVQTTSAPSCKACSVASHVAYLLVCLSVCLVRATNSKTKRRKKTKISENVPHDRGNR